MIFHILYINLIQYLNITIRKIEKNTFEVKYTLNGKLFKNLVKFRKGPSPILQVIDEMSIDVTDEILEYLGPQYNWHGNKMTPRILGYNSLTFECSDGTEIHYKKNEVMKQYF